MRTSTALALGGAYAAYNLGQMEPEARARFVESIVGTAADAFKRFAEDPVGGLKRLWAEKSKSPILFLVGAAASVSIAAAPPRPEERPESIRGDAAATTWIVRGDGSRRRRGSECAAVGRARTDASLGRMGPALDSASRETFDARRLFSPNSWPTPCGGSACAREPCGRGPARRRRGRSSADADRPRRIRGRASPTTRIVRADETRRGRRRGHARGSSADCPRADRPRIVRAETARGRAAGSQRRHEGRRASARDRPARRPSEARGAEIEGGGGGRGVTSPGRGEEGEAEDAQGEVSPRCLEARSRDLSRGRNESSVRGSSASRPRRRRLSASRPRRRLSASRPRRRRESSILRVASLEVASILRAHVEDRR